MNNLKTFYLYLFLFISPCFSFSRTGSVITDLTSTNSADFDTEASAWTLPDADAVCPSCSKTYMTPDQCGIPQVPILGGPNIIAGSSQSWVDFTVDYGSSTAGLNVALGIEFDIWVFYNQVRSDPSDTSFYDIPDLSIPKISTRAEVVESCVKDFTDSGGVSIKAFYKLHIQWFFQYNNMTQLTIKMRSLFTAPSTVSSFGFRNVVYYLSARTSNPIVAANYPCDSGYYWNGCSTCGGSASDLCSACQTTPQFKYPDSTCLSTCPSPLTVFPAGNCVSPCTNVNDYIFQNGSCTSQCLSPLVGTTVNNIKYCKSPCSGQYIYLDGSCSTDCLAPLVKFDESADIKYCRTPCANVNDYVFPNGTCTSQCPSLLVKSTVRGNNFCSSSCPNQYIYYDGSCSTDCVAPMVQRAESTIKFCVIPCANPQYYYYEVDQKCLPTCADPYEVQQLFNLKICRMSGNLNLNVQQVQETKAMVAGLTSANSAGAAGGKASASMSSSSPALAFLAGQVSLLFSVRYINVGYPDKVKLMFRLQGASPFSISFDFNVPDGVEKKLVKRSPPAIFEAYEVPSNFLENSWDTLMTLIFILLSILALSVVMKALKGKCPIVKRILEGLLSFLKWNIPLMIFCSSFGDMYFFASLQFQAGISGGTAWEVVSFLLAILMMIIGVVIVLIPVKIARDIMKDKEAEEKWENFGLLFSGQKRTSVVSLCYMAFYLGVTIISNMIIANLYAYPLCQALLVTMISLVMFLFLVIQRPLKETKMFIQVIVNQLFLMVVNVCVVILAIMDELEIGKQDIRDKVGQGITMIFFFSMASGIGFAGIDGLFALFSLYKLIKKLKSQGSLSLKGVFNALIYGGGIQEKSSEKFQRKLDIEQRRMRPVQGINRQSTDLSLGGKLALQPPRKGRSPLNISYLDSNTSGIELIHQQSSDYSFDLSGRLDVSPSFPSRGRLPNQQRLNKINRQISHQRSDFSVETINYSPQRPPPKGSASTFQPKIKQMRAKHPDGENERRAQKIFNISNVSSPKRKINQTTSHSPKRKNQIQKRKK